MTKDVRKVISDALISEMRANASERSSVALPDCPACLGTGSVPAAKDFGIACPCTLTPMEQVELRQALAHLVTAPVVGGQWTGAQASAALDEYLGRTRDVWAPGVVKEP